MIRLVLALLLFTVSVFAAIELHSRYHIDLSSDPLTRAHELVDDGRYAEARMLTQFLLENPRLASSPKTLIEARTLNAAISEELDSFSGMARRFVKGAISGEPRDIAGFMGSLSLDLFVIGDIRDLIVQGTKEITNNDGDTIILALSAAGLATTVTPHLDWAPSLMKAFRRAGAMSKRFAKRFATLCKTAIRAGDYKSVAKVSEHFGIAAAKMGPGPLMGVMKHVDDPADLARLARASEIDAKATYMIGTTTSGRGLRLLSSDGKNISGLSKRLRTSSRFLKQLRKGTQIIPTGILAAIGVVAFLLSVGLLIRRLVAMGFTRRRRL